MNRNKLTPCRKVGLSRKKNTPVKTVEVLLNENNSNSPNITGNTSITQNLEKVIIDKRSPKIELNHDTPCRQVGLSRKRKSTPLNNTCKRKTSLPSVTVKEEISRKECSTENLPILEKSTCVKKLSSTFSSSPTYTNHEEEHKSETVCSLPVRDNEKTDTNKIATAINLIELKKSVVEAKTSTNQEEKPKSKNVCSLVVRDNEKTDKNKIATDINSIELKESIVETETSNSQSQKLVVHTDKLVLKDRENFSENEKQNGDEFIKVCYSSRKTSFESFSELEKKTECSAFSKKSKSVKENHDIDDHDDDFQIYTKQKKTFKRFQTDVPVSNSKKKINKKKQKH
ncbi:hypothetical protein HHI36_009347 [Cryptolaemus montrouzieri]|uniref:Uncharacterized protein n=1 Tax=Cryptolaemus montrouzieri TaxID=559131 RepID=A0ABD2MW03_9CUCU